MTKDVHRILFDLDFLKEQDASEQQDAIAALAKKYGVVGLEGLKAKALEVKKALEEAEKALEVIRVQEAKDAAEALARKPSTCEPAIQGCAVAYESADCNGGWKLPIKDGVSLHQHLYRMSSPPLS